MHATEKLDIPADTEQGLARDRGLWTQQGPQLSRPRLSRELPESSELEGLTKRTPSSPGIPLPSPGLQSLQPEGLYFLHINWGPSMPRNVPRSGDN